ncbi:MAG: hypothetical protein FH751_00835 [Firmicutes bacterium]|nr:hypothetical protein [Bacillota bacterium]
MKLKEIKEILNAEVLTGGEYLDREVHSAFGSDLMSDVLAFVDDGTILLTGLTNPQVIRTAEMIDLFAIIFVRGKKPGEDILKLARNNKCTILKTDHILFTASGLLYKSGLRGVKIEGAKIND